MNVDQESYDLLGRIKRLSRKDSRLLGPHSPINLNRLVFTYKFHLLTDTDVTLTAEEEVLKENVFNTTEYYPDAEVSYLNNSDCFDLIKDGGILGQPDSSSMAEYFEKEKRGMYKSDICRLFALYDEGGIYFDNDIKSRFAVTELINQHNLMNGSKGEENHEEDVDSSKISFSTALSHDKRNFFQAYLAVGPKNPIILLAIKYTLQYYKGKRKLDGQWMGTVILRYSLVAFLSFKS